MILDHLVVTGDEFAKGTGWEPKDIPGGIGMCRGEVCVPMPPNATTDGGGIDVTVAAERLRMPLAHDAGGGVWALGPAVVSGRALESATAADPELMDRDGNPFKLSALHGRRVLLVAWSSY